MKLIYAAAIIAFMSPALAQDFPASSQPVPTDSNMDSKLNVLHVEIQALTKLVGDLAARQTLVVPDLHCGAKDPACVKYATEVCTGLGFARAGLISISPSQSASDAVCVH